MKDTWWLMYNGISIPFYLHLKANIKILSECFSGVTQAKSAMWPLIKKQQQHIQIHF